MVFQGWIRRTEMLQQSEWVQRAIRYLLEFYHDMWHKRNEAKFGGDIEARKKIQKEQLLEQIYDAYQSRNDIFWHELDTYDKILFRVEIDKWESAPIKNMQAWLKTYRQAINRRSEEFFDFNVSEYFQFNQATDIQTFGDID